MPIYRPGTINPRKKNMLILLYGVEASFKTSTALTSDNAILHDFNEIGSSRAVNIAEKTRFIPEKGWTEFIHHLTNNTFDDYDVHIIDTTADMLMKHLAPALIAETPSLKSPTGGLSKDGYAAIGARFQEDFMSKFDDKVLIFIAHDTSVQEGDIVKHVPNIPGAVGQYILGNADQIGYFEKTDKEGVIIKFSNSNYYRSKDTAKVGDIEIPDSTTKEWPTFFQDKVINPLAVALNMVDTKKKLRENAVTQWTPKIQAVKDETEITALLKQVNESGMETTSLQIVKNAINIRSKEMGLSFDPKEKKFIKTTK